MSVAEQTLESVRGSIQESQYAFPYHYLPDLSAKGEFIRHRSLLWGFEYMCYLMHAKDIVERLDPRSVLEVGCGDGRFAGLLATHGRRVVGADISERAIGFARAFHPDLEFHAIDANEMDEQFELTAAIEVLEHIPDEHLNGFMQMLSDRTAPGGHILISVPSVVKKVTAKHYRHYTADLVRQHFKNAGIPFEIKSLEFVYAEPAWFRFLRRVTSNGLWSLYVPHVETVAWKLIWNRYRCGSESQGRHVVALAQKMDG